MKLEVPKKAQAGTPLTNLISINNFDTPNDETHVPVNMTTPIKNSSNPNMVKAKRREKKK
jgi:hypothetical protein